MGIAAMAVTVSMMVMCTIVPRLVIMVVVSFAARRLYQHVGADQGDRRVAGELNAAQI
jgi:hypothetical protein